MIFFYYPTYEIFTSVHLVDIWKASQENGLVYRLLQKGDRFISGKLKQTAVQFNLYQS